VQCARIALIEAIDGQAGTRIVRKDALALACRAICAEDVQEGMRLARELKRTRSGISIEMVHEHYAQLARDAEEVARGIEQRERRLQRLLATRRRVRMHQPTYQVSLL
jgi:predicted nucleotidyltransferase